MTKWLTANRFAAFLMFLALVVGGGNLWANHVQIENQVAAQHRAQAAQARAAEMVEHKLCTTLGKLAALTPPPGNAATNPSRAYEQLLNRTLSQLGPDLGCSG